MDAKKKITEVSTADALSTLKFLATQPDGGVESIKRVPADSALDLLKIQNENILINPDFFVNQRADPTASDYPSYIGIKWGIDRWRGQNGNTKVTPDTDYGCVLESTNSSYSADLAQHIELSTAKQLEGKTLTMSVMLRNGEILKASFLMPTATDTEVTVKAVTDTGNFDSYNYGLWFRYGNGYCYMYIRNNTSSALHVAMAMLEVGNRCTIDRYVVNHETELSKCKRYHQEISSYYSNMPIGYGIATAANVIRARIPLEVEMRKNPTVSFKGGIANNLRYMGAGQSVAKTFSVVAESTFHINGPQIEVLFSNLTDAVTNEAYVVCINASSATMMFDAEVI